MTTVRAHPPETTEGWYVLHQIFTWNRAQVRAASSEARKSALDVLDQLSTPAGGGWSAVVPLIGSRSDFMLVHFRPTLEEIGDAQVAVSSLPLFDAAARDYHFLSITEAGLYYGSAELEKEAVARGGKVGDDAHREAMAARVAKERAGAHVQRRIFPEQPAEMPYVCFYPMSKRRNAGQNWYTLPLEERSRLMMEHGTTGRGYAGKVSQVISGAIGLDAWEWGVTLFAADPLQFKKIVTDMRFDEVSANYAEFGDFYVGKRVTPTAFVAALP